MNHLLNISRSGINGLQKKLDVTAQNLANVNTVGYKHKTLQFKELLNNPINAQAPANQNALPAAINRGTKAEEEQNLFQSGSLSETGNTWDFAISRESFFGVRNQNGQLLLTKDGAFHQNETGALVNQSGQTVEVVAIIPTNQWPKGETHVDPSGNITIKQGANYLQVGRLQTYQATNENDLQAVGNNTYQLNTTGQLIQNPINATIRQGVLEQSTTDVAQTMTEMMVTQRAYSLNTRALQSTDEMFSTINRLTD